ncbi:MAG: flagellar hook-basal body complex protein [Lachnospiraceae bacterium]|nr:flagellar hook-basal body complex protein [Lachnospiraceae bacterium]
MMRSMYSGVSGLKTHQTKMDVIGNNIANVNTVAYKSSSITFSELMYQTTQKSSGPNDLTGTGGTNARQIGLGVQSAAINTAISSQGATQTTGNPFDICITGQSFFIVSDGNDNYFTRAGAFTVDAVGNLVMTSNGYNVMGWGVDDTTGTIRKDTVEPLRIMSAEKLVCEPEATEKSYVSGIMDKNDEDAATEAGRALSLSFYDNLGYSYTAKFSVHSTLDDGVYYVQLDDVLSKGTDGKMHSITEQYPGTVLSDIVNIGTTFEANVSVAKSMLPTASVPSVGTIRYVSDATTDPVTMTDWALPTTTAAPVTVNMKEDGTTIDSVTWDFTGGMDATMQKQLKDIYGFSDADLAALKKVTINYADGTLTIDRKEVNGSKLTYDTNNGYFRDIDGEKFITMDFATTLPDGTPMEKFSDIEMDWSASNMYNNSGTSTITAVSGDTKGLGTGRRLGNMSGITVQTNGMIYASYDNGMTQLLGQIAVAEFANAAGLEKAGENLYSASLNSGEFDGVGVDITASGGYMTTGVLEMSNVDLSAEFTEMITTQRGFQANSRIITVSDTMLEELVNLKR